MTTQAARAESFRELHRTGTFVVPNPWDAGTARLLAHLGFPALASTSMGYAFSTGRRDTAVGRDEMLAHVASLASATDLPVSADLENGYGDSPAACAETIRLSAETGVVGGSIEDATGDPDDPVYDLDRAAERVTAAAEAARSLPFPYTLTARAENYLHGRPDLADTIRRLQRYQECGADVLYAPGLRSAAEIGALVRSVDRPVNVLMGLTGPALTVAELTALGARRISVGSALARAALGGFLRAAEEIRDHGTFTFADHAVSPAQVNPVWDAAGRTPGTATTA